MRQLTSSLLARSPAAETWKNCRTLIHLEDGPPDVSPNSLCFGFPFELWWLWGSLGYLPRGPVGKIIECWYFHSLLEDAGGCFHSIFLKKGLPGCLQFYHDNCSKPGEKLNQEIIDRLQTENTHLKSWSWVERDFCDLWWFSRFQRGDIWFLDGEILNNKSSIWNKTLFPKVTHCGLIPTGGRGAENCWRPMKPRLRFPWHKAWGNRGLLVQLEIQDQRGFGFLQVLPSGTIVGHHTS